MEYKLIQYSDIENQEDLSIDGSTFEFPLQMKTLFYLGGSPSESGVQHPPHLCLLVKHELLVMSFSALWKCFPPVSIS